MSGKASQRKGANGERELAAKLRSYGFEIERGGSMSFGEVPDLVGLPGVHIEVKRVERLNVGEAMWQAINDSERFQDGAPVLCALVDDGRRVDDGGQVDKGAQVGKIETFGQSDTSDSQNGTGEMAPAPEMTPAKDTTGGAFHG